MDQNDLAEIDSKAAELASSGFAYVRVQDDIHGMHIDASGSLVVPYHRESMRHTMHWCPSGLVGDHANGSFTMERDGSLKGKVVIIADPREMPTPRAINQADTWFTLDAKLTSNGGFQRSMTVGRATVIAPHGTEIQPGVAVVFYDGTLGGRNRAVSAELERRNVIEKQISDYSWKGETPHSSHIWAAAAAKVLYPNEIQYIQPGLHMGSDDDLLSKSSLQVVTDEYERLQERFDPKVYFGEDCSPSPLENFAREIGRKQAVIDAFFRTANPSDIARGGAFYSELKKRMGLDLDRANVVSEAIEARVADTAGQVAALCPSHKEIHFAMPGATRSELLGPADLAKMLVYKQVPNDARIWIAGITENWQLICASPIAEIFNRTAGSAPVQPLPLKLEPLRRNVYPESDRQAVQDSVADAVEADPRHFFDVYKADYRSFGGRYIAADLFKETFPEYRASKESRNRLNNPLHNSAAVLSSAFFRQQINNPAAPEEQDTVVFLTGIPGAGKTSSVVADKQLDGYIRCVFEGQLSNPETTFEKIQQVLDAGLKPVIMAVHARPEDALANTFRRFNETGRGASINVMASIQGGLPACLKAVQKRFGNEVVLQVNDFRDRSNPKILQGWDNLPILQSEGTHDQIKNRLSSALGLYASTKIISTACHRQASGLPPIDNGPKDGELEQQDDGECSEDARGREFSPAGG